MRSINIVKEDRNPSQEIFQKIHEDLEYPEYVTFSKFVDGFFTEELDTNIRAVPKIIQLDDNGYLDILSNVAIHKDLLLELSLIPFNNFAKGISHYLITQNEYDIYRFPILKNHTDYEPDINPYMRYLYRVADDYGFIRKGVLKRSKTFKL